MGVTGCSLGSQNKIGHSAHCQKQLMPVPVLGARNISERKAFETGTSGFIYLCLP